MSPLPVSCYCNAMRTIKGEGTDGLSFAEVGVILLEGPSGRRRSRSTGSTGKWHHLQPIICRGLSGPQKTARKRGFPFSFKISKSEKYPWTYIPFNLHLTPSTL